MKFWEAMKAIEDGKKVTWSGFNNGTYIDKSNIGFLCLGDFYLKDLIGNEWELYEECPKLLNFHAVIEGLKYGRKYKRASSEWPNKALVQLKEEEFIANFDQIQIRDIEATDWIQVKE